MTGDLPDQGTPASGPGSGPGGDLLGELLGRRPDGAAGDAAAAAPAPRSAVEDADLADKYDQMMRLADEFDAAGQHVRERARLGVEILRDPDVADSADLSRSTWTRAEDDIRAATAGKHGLLTRSIELDADALVLRATVLTYRWIDELQSAAFETLGSIAGRAIGYLAPGVALGGAIVSAGLIETDALDRDGVAAYLNELAENNPELMDHVSSGGGGLLDGLQMRSMLTVGVLAGDTQRVAAAGGLRAAGVADFPTDLGSALRDVAGGLVHDGAPVVEAPEAGGAGGPGVPGADDPVQRAPRTIEELLTALAASRRSVTVQRVGPQRYIAYLPGPEAGEGRLRLVGGDHTAYDAEVVAAVERAVAGDEGARVMLVGSAQGGVTAAEIAATVASPHFVVDQVVTAGAPGAQVTRVPETTRVLSLEDRSDPVALLGSLVNAGLPHRVTVVFEGASARADGTSVYLAGARAADSATHPELRAEIQRLQGLGYLAG
ncbi:hypothetical protein [Nocardioides sp. P86]|uniref:hypothetical protein n=1 Tax=Nocardioides sp. P86 TaxID=2939569 RepID=UPI002041B247|nr:hypothetical protein [Nocardioides sp. P86]MCM3516783.1 hypothetical protein [Nocardioides sp. P86]